MWPVEAKWFDTEKRFSLVDSTGNPIAHLFFDPFPAVNQKTQLVEVIPLTWEGSSHQYAIDLVSGQKFVQGPYCSVSDQWERTKLDISRPPYTLAYLPKYLDDLGRPQQVYVFGLKKTEGQVAPHTREVRVIGGIIQHVCLHGKCRPKEWVKSLVLIAVDLSSDKYGKLLSIEELKKETEWPYVRGFFENGEGQNFFAGNYHPAFKMGNFIPAKKSLHYVKKNSYKFTDDKLSELKNQCYGLYDEIWHQFGTNKRSFAKRFTSFFSQRYKDIRFCSKYVLPSSINDDHERHWFMAHILGLVYMRDSGLYFDCQSQVWRSNPLGIEGKPTRNFDKEFKKCDNQAINAAFKNMKASLKSIYKTGGESLRYVEYDDQEGGTHRKLHWWVRYQGARPKCQIESTKFREFFPKDINWKDLPKSDKLNRNDVIIR